MLLLFKFNFQPFIEEFIIDEPVVIAAEAFDLPPTNADKNAALSADASAVQIR
jgi:hypothetical protein